MMRSLLLLTLACPLTLRGDETQLLPVPDAAAQKQALAQLKSVFQAEYQKRSAADQQRFARELLTNARETGQPAMKFAMLSESRELAISLGDVTLAIEATNAIAANFDIEAVGERARTAGEIIRQVKTDPGRRLFVSLAFDLAEPLIAKGEFVEASKLLTQAEGFAKRLKDLEASKQAREWKADIRLISAENDRVAKFRDTLVQSPDDPAANHAVGRYEALYRGDWETGLPKLAKSNDQTIRSLAEKTLTGAKSPEAQYELGNLWWDYADSLSGIEQNQAKRFAAGWYRQAHANLAGFNQTVAEKRIEEARDLDNMIRRRRTINLIPLIDPKQDAVNGDWKIEDGRLVCTSMHFVPKVQIRYQPPAEFDFTIVFSQPKLRNPVVQIMPKNGNSFSWELGGTEGRIAFSVESGGKNPTESKNPGAAQPNTRYTSVVKVRDDGVEAYIDGKLVARYRTNFADMKANNWRALKDKSLLGVGCDDPTVFYVVELKEITGQGKHVRE